MVNFTIQYEHKQSVQDVARLFQSQLSDKEIKKTVDWSLNDTTRRVQGFIRSQISKEYTVSKVYLNKVSRISRYSNYKKGSQYTETAFDYTTIPMSAFKYTGTVGRKRPVSVTIRKGKTMALRHAFVMANKTAKTGNKGIYAKGYYANGKFVYKPNAEGMKTTQLKSASGFTMATSLALRPKIGEYVAKRLPSQLKYMLQRKVEKMRNN